MALPQTTSLSLPLAERRLIPRAETSSSLWIQPTLAQSPLLPMIRARQSTPEHILRENPSKPRIFLPYRPSLSVQPNADELHRKKSRQ